MSTEHQKRPARIPFNSEELARIMAFKKSKAEQKLKNFKASSIFKFLNIVNVVCFFMYWEVILCFFGPLSFQPQNLSILNVKYELHHDIYDRPFVKEIKLGSEGMTRYNLVVNDFLKIPSKSSMEVEIGGDYIFHKDLKARFYFSDSDYRLKEADPVFFISGFIIFISCIAFYFDLNEHPYSLSALSALNVIALLLFIFI